MSRRDQYMPGPAADAQVSRHGDKCTLVLVRELGCAAEKLWQALTDPASLREWAPFDADRSLASPGPVKLSTVGAPTPQISDTVVTRADAPTLLEYNWGGNDMRWQLEASGDRTRLTLTHELDCSFVAMGAAGWHICIDVLARLVADQPVGRIVGGDAMNFDWPRLNAEYAQRFGV